MFEKTPLIQAIDKGDMTTAIELYQQGEKIPHSQHSYDYNQLYDTLLRNKGYELINLMSENGEIEKDIYMLDKIDGSIYSSIIKKRNPDEDFVAFLQDFISSSDNINDEVSGETLLSYAIQSKVDSSIIKAMVDAGCRVDFKDNSENNLINISIKKHDLKGDELISYVEILSNEGIDINEPNKIGQTALHIAMESNKSNILDLLLQNGADPNQQDHEGNSAFFIAVAHKGNIDLYKKLAEYDSMDFEQTNKRGEKALHHILKNTSGFSHSVDLILQMIEDGVDLKSTCMHYDNAYSGWYWIAQQNAESFQKIFNSAGPDINEQDDLGNTLLHLVVVKDSNHDQNVAKETYKKVKFLLDNGASASMLNNQEKTAMMLASEDNLKGKTVELLLIAEQKER